MNKGGLAIDPRGLIFESYRMDGIGSDQCRTIFLDWALGLPAQSDVRSALLELQRVYASARPDHPMSALISQGLAREAVPKGRRRRARHRN